jgi:predicted transcriptional regulator
MESFKELHRFDNFEFRLLDDPPLFLQMNENGIAILAFPTRENTIDFMGFEATDNRSIKWCKDIFNYLWDKSKPFFPNF